MWLRFWRYVYYNVLKGGFENNAERLGRSWFTSEEAAQSWKHHGRWYAKFVARRISPKSDWPLISTAKPYKSQHPLDFDV